MQQEREAGRRIRESANRLQGGLSKTGRGGEVTGHPVWMCLMDEELTVRIRRPKTATDMMQYCEKVIDVEECQLVRTQESEAVGGRCLAALRSVPSVPATSNQALPISRN